MKKILIFTFMVISIIIISIATFFVKSKNDINKYNTSVKALATKFYEEKFYESHYAFINKFSKDGIVLNFSLYDILIMSGYSNKSIKQTTFYKKCDLYNTIIRYQLFTPISKDSFNLTFDLNCK